MNKTVGIYIHIPYCTSKCIYCDFNSCSINKAPIAPERYVEALVRDIIISSSKLDALEVKSIFFGGGTPTSIDSKLIAKVLNTLKKHFKWTSDIEITVECNPETLSKVHLNDFKASGVNRLSIGLQTIDDDLLKVIGRNHSYDIFLKAFHLARSEGFENINVDLIFGLPGQKIEDFIKSVKTIALLNPTHVASYSLKVEEGTPLYDMEKKGVFKVLDDEQERKMYYALVETLGAYGLKQYELSNFALSGFESKHNLIYWENGPYLGFGVSAHSKFGGKRCFLTSDITQYVKNIESGLDPPLECETIDSEEDLFESIILGLRLNKGIDISYLNEKYGIDFMKKYENVIKKHLENALLSFDGKILKLTSLGRDLSNVVFVDFL